jgi:hypothetical protein
MLSVTDVAALPAAIVAGEKFAVAPVGRPVAVNVTPSAKVVPAGISMKLKPAVAPGATVVLVAEVPAARLKASPTPLLFCSPHPSRDIDASRTSRSV